MKAYNGNHEFKNQLVDMALKHQEQDEYIKGNYFQLGGSTFKGCAVGCAIKDVSVIKNIKINNYSDHGFLAESLNVPLFLIKMQDQIYEKCSEKMRKYWPVEFLKAIQVGADYKLLMPKFLLFVLKDIECDDVKNVLNDWIKTGAVDKEAAGGADSAAAAAYEAAYAAAAAGAAYSAAVAAGAGAVAYAAGAAAYAAAGAAYAAAGADDAAAAAYAYEAAYDSYAKEIIRLLTEVENESI